MKIGIVGLPNVGKSTLFKALTKQEVEIANYPFATISPHVGIVPVPDTRLEKLARLSNSKKTIPAVVEFMDIAGLVKGAAEGEGLGNAFLSHIRETDAIAEVVRIFEDTDIIHVSGTPDPVSDIEIIEYELILKDLEIIEKRLNTARSNAKGHKKGAEEEVAALEYLQTELKSGKKVTEIESRFTAPFQELHLLTAKPIIYVFNVSESNIQNNWQPDTAIQKKIKSAPFVEISAKIESELAQFQASEKNEYLASFGLKESGLDALIRLSYTTLGLLTFFTTGEDETRAWTIPIGSTAPRAGRAIHSDFEEKFIRAEVIHTEKLLTAGSFARARDLGWLRIEGKEYIVRDGDVIEFKI